MSAAQKKACGEESVQATPAPTTPRTPGTPQTPSRKSLIVVRDIPDEYALLRKGALSPDNKRNNPDNRYKDGAYKGAARFTPQGPERGLWVRSTDDLDSRKNNKTTYRTGQLFMLYFTGDTFKERNVDYSVFNIEPIRWSNGPVYGPENVRLPVNIRPGSDYLGACLLDLPDVDLHPLFPADVAEDGFPFGDHIPSGNSFRPRLSQNDLPAGGVMVSDSRIAFARFTNGDVVFFGGEHFTAKSITDYQWANLHHFFVDITGRRGRDLPSAFDHPEEVRRRQAHSKQTKENEEDMFCPTGAESQFTRAAETVSWALEKVSTFLDDPDNAPRITTDERSDILDALPTRGYNATVPTYEIISHLALSGTAYAAGTEALLVQSKIDFGKYKSLLQSVDGMLNMLGEAQFTPSGLSDETIGQMLLELRDEIVSLTQSTMSLSRGVEAAVHDIATPKSIARFLPVSVYGSPARRLCDATDNAIIDTMVEPDFTIFPTRKNWNDGLTLSDDDPAWMTKPAAPRSFLAPYSTTPTARRTDQLLRQALSAPIIKTTTTVRQPDMTPSSSKSKDNEIRAQLLRSRWNRDGEPAKFEGPPMKKPKVEAPPTRRSPRNHPSSGNANLATTQTNK
jgi:hypothetical protein